MISKLSRKRDVRNQLIANLATSLILYGQIKTTLSKAKSVQPYIDRIFSTAKKDTLAARRQVTSMLNDKKAVAKIFEIGLANISNIQSGFSSIIKTAPRRGDGAAMSIIKLRKEIFELKKETTQEKKKVSEKPASKEAK